MLPDSSKNVLNGGNGQGADKPIAERLLEIARSIPRYINHLRTAFSSLWLAYVKIRWCSRKRRFRQSIYTHDRSEGVKPISTFPISTFPKTGVPKIY